MALDGSGEGPSLAPGRTAEPTRTGRCGVAAVGFLLLFQNWV